MPQGLKRYQKTGNVPFITFSCHHRLPYLAPDHPKQIFEHILEQTRVSHGFGIYAYVLMPEHVHLLLSEPTQTDLATTLKVLKQQTSKLLESPGKPFWLPRYDDLDVYTEGKRLEKLRYIHRNPVTRGLAKAPADYPWSSAPHYATGTPFTVPIASHRTTPEHTRAAPTPSAHSASDRPRT